MTRQILVACLAVSCLAGCPDDLPEGDVLTPQYWGDYFLNKYADELVVGELEVGPPKLEQPRTVLLITGVTIPAKWFDPIVARLERDGFRPVVYEPPELLSYDLFEATRDLAEVVERVQAESGQEKIDILAECTGGVIARHYIQSMGGDELVERMVTFVSPQHGLPKAAWAYKLAGWPALDDLTPGSEFLEAVNSAPLPDSVRFTSIYTCDDEYIQPYSTSVIDGANNIEICGDEFVGHFQTFYDPAIYNIMHGALIEGLEVSEDTGELVEPEPEDDAPTAAGCSTSGTPGAPAALLLAAVLLGFRRRRAV